MFNQKKSTEKLFFMTLKSDAKFEEKLTCILENDISNMAYFHKGTGSLKLRL